MPNKKQPKESTFSERVLKIALSIPPGKVTTYGRIAQMAGGSPILAQSITSILSKMDKDGSLGIPYHRIVYANGKVWMDEEYRAEREWLYKKEGIQIDKKGKIINFRDILI